MNVVSVNIGGPKHIFWNKKSFFTSIYKIPTKKKVFVTKDGIVGDSQANTIAHGGINKAVYAYSADHYDYWKNFLGINKMPWGMFGENITIDGLSESDICIGDILKIGEVELMAVQPRQPCSKLGLRFDDITMVKKFWDAEMPGIYFKVIKEGAFKKGDSVNIFKKSSISFSMELIYKALKNEVNKYQLEEILSIEVLPESIKNDLLKNSKV